MLGNHFSLSSRLSNAQALSCFLGLFFILAYMSVNKYLSLHSSYADLGIFLNKLDRIKTGEWQQLFNGHVQPGLLPYLILTMLPGKLFPVLLLVTQALALGLPVYLLGKNYGSIASIAYILYFPVWYLALFDFHLDHLAVLFLALFYISYKNRCVIYAGFWAISLCFLKETFALQTVFCGIYLFITPAFRRVALIVILIGIAWFLISVSYVLPVFSIQTGGVFSGGGFGWLGGNVREIVITLLTSPLEVIKEVFSSTGKLIYLVLIFGGLGAISVFDPKTLVPVIPPLTLSMLSSEANYYGYGHHYTAGLIIPMVIALSHSMEWLKKKLSSPGIQKIKDIMILVCILSVHIIIAPSPVGRLFWSDKIWAYNWRAYTVSDRDLAIQKFLEKDIPNNREAVVITQNTLNWESMARHRHYFSFPFAAERQGEVADWGNKSDFKPVKRAIRADYVVIDLKRPWFIQDRGCEWYFGFCHDAEAAAEFVELIAGLQSQYRKIREFDGFMIFMREEV